MPNAKARRRREFAYKIGTAIISFFFFLWIVPVVLLYTFQRQLTYAPGHRVDKPPEVYGLSDFQAVPVTAADGMTVGNWFHPPADKDGEVVVVFHGNNVNLGAISFTAPLLLKSGRGVFMCEYRGFGGAPGHPTEEGLYEDARAAIRWLGDHGYPARRLIFYGASLGTGVAVQMAAETRPAMLVLLAPYSSVVDVMQMRYPIIPVWLLLKDRYDNMAKIGQAHTPLLILHGTDDYLVPIAAGKALFLAANRPKDFYRVEGVGHDDLLYNPETFKIVNEWIDKQAKMARQGR